MKLTKEEKAEIRAEKKAWFRMLRMLIKKGALVLPVIIILLAMLSARTSPNVNQAEVNQLQGIYIFTDSKPLQPYDYLGTVKKTVTFAGGIQYAAIRDRMIKKVKSDYPTADGIIFYGNADRCDAIKFK